LINFIRNVIDTIGQAHQENFISEPDVVQDFRLLYVETHYSLCEILLYLLDGEDEKRLHRASKRLEQWIKLNPSQLHFNAFAPALSLCLLNRHGLGGSFAAELLRDLCKKQKLGHVEVFESQCGNNMYFLQLATDTILRPIALGQMPQLKEMAFLTGEWERYRSKEGFFYDLPRHTAIGANRFFPLTYCLKFLFIMGICEHLFPNAKLRSMFVSGMQAILPLLTKEGSFSYFGRTDNTTFSIGLVIFNLRSLATFAPELSEQCLHYAILQEKSFQTTPRTLEGGLQVNRMSDARKPEEFVFSRDHYAYPTQYAIAGCCYVLCAWLFNRGTTLQPERPLTICTQSTFSQDLGIVKIQSPNGEVFVRTTSQPEARDRRYFGPTILRFTKNGSLLIGAIPKTVDTDFSIVHKKSGQPWKLLDLLLFRYRHGYDDLDAISTGFLPTFRFGNCLCIPRSAKSIQLDRNILVTEHDWQFVKFNGFHAIRMQLGDLFEKNFFKSKGDQEWVPDLHDAFGWNLVRRVVLDGLTLCIEDSIQGPIKGKKIIYIVRHTSGAHVKVSGLNYQETRIGWSSDGIALLDLYASECTGTDIHYSITVAPQEVKSKPTSWALAQEVRGGGCSESPNTPL